MDLLSGDDDQIRDIIKWAETKRQANNDVEEYTEKYLTHRGSSSVLEEMKKAFDNEYSYSNFACEIYALLLQRRFNGYGPLAPHHGPVARRPRRG